MGKGRCSTAPDINQIREVAEEQAGVAIKEFSKSKTFTKMCAGIQDAANKGDFHKTFDFNQFEFTSMLHADALYSKSGYVTRIIGYKLLVMWGQAIIQK